MLLAALRAEGLWLGQGTLPMTAESRGWAAAGARSAQGSAPDLTLDMGQHSLCIEMRLRADTQHAGWERIPMLLGTLGLGIVGCQKL